jgi:hypothetical protein
MFGHHQANDIAPVIFDAVGIGEDKHALGGGRNAGGHEATGLLVFNQTQPTGTDGFQFRMIAEFGNFYSVRFGSLQKASPYIAIYNFAINGQADLFHDKAPSHIPSDSPCFAQCINCNSDRLVELTVAWTSRPPLKAENLRNCSGWKKNWDCKKQAYNDE